ncbi:F420H(2):quinone oxidoreductase, partial [Akkermansia sp. BIOML-A6]
MDQIIEKDDCCGCGACAWACPRHCIKMVADAEGFLYPDINQDDCIDCHI